MARYKKRPTYDSSMPGLFDDFDAREGTGSVGVQPLFQSPLKSEGDMPLHPEIEKAASKFRLEAREKDASRKEPKEVVFSDDFSPLEEPMPIDKISFISFGSGSSGNCAYLGTSEGGILIDAGVDANVVEAELRRFGIKMSNIRAVLLTHDHSDHVRFVYPLVRKREHIGVYCTPKVLNGILRRHNISRRIKDYHHAIYKEHPFTVAGFNIVAFEVHHDGTDNAGFFINRGRHNLAVATDLGEVSDRVDFYMRQANYIMIEANYDNAMLDSGTYPEYLKARIRSANGHLCNDETARYLASIVTPGLRRVFLCHLSKDNNTPELALHAVESALAAAGVTVGDGSGTPYSRSADLQLQALPRFDSTGLIPLR